MQLVTGSELNQSWETSRQHKQKMNGYSTVMHEQATIISPNGMLLFHKLWIVCYLAKEKGRFVTLSLPKQIEAYAPLEHIASAVPTKPIWWKKLAMAGRWRHIPSIIIMDPTCQ